jgi:hypothetical protein
MKNELHNESGLELDDLKTAWKKLQSKELIPEKEERDKIMQIIERSRKGILTALTWEIILTLIIYISVLAVAFLFHSRLSSYHFKLLILVWLFAIPVFYRMSRSVSFLNQIDYGSNIRTNLTEFLVYYKTTIQFYRWGGYITICTLIVVFFTDAAFLNLQVWIQGLIVVYLIIVFFALGPLIKTVYGSKIKSIEIFLSDPY